MAQFRVLNAADLEEIMGAFGVPPDDYRAHQSIAAGTINTNLRVELADGEVRFLRVNEGKSAEDVEREAAIVLHVSRGGVPTPVPFRSTAGEPFVRWRGQIVSLFPWVPGRTLARPALTAVQARQAGRALAQLHAAGTTYPDHRGSRYEPAEIERRLETIAVQSSNDQRLAEAVTVLGPELARLRAARAAALPTGLIHGDLFIDNVLFEGDDLVALLDFEQASWGRLAYDLAVTTLAWGFGRDDFRPEVVRALFEGYASHRSLTDAERASFGDELRFAACRFAVTRITDVYLRRGAGAAPGKDFGRYLQRLARVDERLAAGDPLLIPVR